MKKIILGVVFVFLGFSVAFFIFKFLTTEKPAVISSLPIPQQLPSARPISSSAQPNKDLERPSAANIDTVPKSNTQALLQEKKQVRPVESQEAEKKELPTLFLNGIFSSDGDNLALINNHIVKEGDLISGVRVLRIYANKVELDADGQKITLRVK